MTDASKLREIVLGEYVRQSREERGLTQVAFADAVGMSQRWVSDIERGITQTPRMSTLHRMAAVLHENIEVLIVLAGYASSIEGARSIRNRFMHSLSVEEGSDEYQYASEEERRDAELRQAIHDTVDDLKADRLKEVFRVIRSMHHAPDSDFL